MKRILAIALATLLALPGLALAQGKFAYTELKPTQPTESAPGKVEVLEFFWYGCPHCYSLEPAIEVWTKKLPADVQFRRVPAVFNERWGHDAAIFYTFEALGVLNKLHRPFFDAIHRDRLRTDNAAAFNGWLQKQGVDPQKFAATMRSMGVMTSTKRAAKLTVDYDIRGTPAMAVHGRYTVGSDEAMLQTVDKLVAAVRKNK